MNNAGIDKIIRDNSVTNVVHGFDIRIQQLGLHKKSSVIQNSEFPETRNLPLHTENGVIMPQNTNSCDT